MNEDFVTPRTREVLVPAFYEKVVRRYHRRTPATAFEALIDVAPFEHVEESTEEKSVRLEPLRRALDPDGGVLTPRERWIVEAVFFRRISFRDLAEEIPWSTTHLHRLKNAALQKLKDHLEQEMDT